MFVCVCVNCLYVCVCVCVCVCVNCKDLLCPLVMITSNSLSVWLQIIETVVITQNFVLMSSQLVKSFQTKKNDSIEIKNVSQKDVRLIASVIG